MWSSLLSPRRDGFLLLLAVLFGVALRLSHVTDPYIADFHAWRQADTAAFTHGFLVDTLNPFDPSINRYPCEHRDTPFGRVESEWPAVAWVAALPLAALGIEEPPAPYLRAWSICFFAATCLYLYGLVRRLDGSRVLALTSVVAFSVFPLSIFFTRTVQPDGPALCFSVGFVYHLLRWLQADAAATSDTITGPRIGIHPVWHLAASVALAALTLLVKVSNAFMAVPAVYLIVTRRGLRGAVTSVALWAWGLAAVAPVAAWYLHARNFAWSFGIWADRGASKFSDSAALHNADLWQRLGERMIYEVLTAGGVLLLLIGVSRLRGSQSARLSSVWLLAVTLFIAATLKGNNRHIYYQLPLVIPAAILAAHGARWLWERGHVARLVLVAALLVHGATTYELLWSEGKRLKIPPYFRSDLAILEGAALVRKHVPAGQLFVTSERHPALYFNSGRRGYFTHADAGALIRCARGVATYLVLDGKGRRSVARWLSTRPRERARLQEVEHGRHYAVWTYTH